LRGHLEVSTSSFIELISYSRSRGPRLERSAYLHLFHRWKWTLLLAAWVAGLVGFLGASQIDPTYEAEARLVVGPPNADGDTIRGAEPLTLHYAAVATTGPILERAAAVAEIDPIGLKAAVAVIPTSSTRMISIGVTHTDPEVAAAVANAVANEIIAYASSEIDRPDGAATLIDPAVPPTEPVGPNTSLLIFLSAAAGLLIAGLLAISVEYFSNTIRGADELIEVTGSSVLGEVNVGHGYRGSPVQPLVVEAKPESKTALGYRLLASRMPLSGVAGEEPVKSLLIVGSQAGEPVGELTANLAAVLVRTGRRVTVVDADDLEAQVTTMFVPDRRAGVSELLALAPDAIASSDTLESVRVSRAPGIELIPAGSTESRTVREDTVAALLDTLAERSDLVLVSGAPIHRSAQTLMWARHADAVVVAARSDSTRVENLRHAVDSLRLIDAPILGTILLVNRSSRGDRGQARTFPTAPDPNAMAGTGQPGTQRPTQASMAASAAPQSSIASDRRGR
jgi:non-specific protein-tyrosine kinase